MLPQQLQLQGGQGLGAAVARRLQPGQHIVGQAVGIQGFQAQTQPLRTGSRQPLQQLGSASEQQPQPAPGGLAESQHRGQQLVLQLFGPVNGQQQAQRLAVGGLQLLPGPDQRRLLFIRRRSAAGAQQGRDRKST